MLLFLCVQSKKQSGALVQEDCIHKIAEVQVRCWLVQYDFVATPLAPPPQAAYHTLCSIAMELVGALESSVAGEQVGTLH